MIKQFKTEHVKADGQETEQGLKTCGGALYGFESLQGAEISLLCVRYLSAKRRKGFRIRENGY